MSEIPARVAGAAPSEEALAGARDFSLVALPITAFAIMFGAASSAAGYSIWISLWSSATIFAGASQFVFLEVNRLGVPLWSVVLAVFAVNFRHLLYSAAIADKIRHFSFFQKVWGFFLLTDLQFAASEARTEGGAEKRWLSPTYYFGYGIPCYLTWVFGTFLGAFFGSLITDPVLIGLDFVLPIYFLSILMGFRKRASFVPIILASGSVAVLVEKTIGAPWHISLGALAGIAMAVVFRMVRDARRAAQGDATQNPKGPSSV